MKKILFVSILLCCFMSNIDVYAAHEQSGNRYLCDASSKASIGFSEKTYQESSGETESSLEKPTSSNETPNNTGGTNGVTSGIGHLPSTNEQKNQLFTILGILIFILMGLIIYLYFIRRKKNHEKNH